MDHPFFDGLRPTAHIAHRGGAALAPENTLHAFRMAVEQYRTDMLEIDVRLTADGETVVFHDPTLERTTDGQGPLSSLSFRELSALDAGYRFSPDGGQSYPQRGMGLRIPRLTEVLEAFPGVRLNIEAKPGAEGTDEALAKIVRAAGMKRRVCVGSEDDEVATRLVSLLPEVCHFYPRHALIALVMQLKQRAARAPLDSPYLVLDMPLYYEGVRLVDRAFIDSVRALGRWVNVWVVDDEPDMRKLAEDGVGGIMTDRPDLLRTVLDS